jgi:two-component system phosphate regulon sensor histidine kinase PhoR
MRPNFQRLVRHQELMLQRIEREESSMRMVLSSMEEGVLVVDARFRIRLANAAFISGFGLTKSPMDRSVLEVLGEPDVHRLIQEALEKGEARERQLEMIPGKRVRYISVRAVPMSDENGLPGVLAVFRDVTRLQELEQVRREFVANVSHELRTPLAIFQGYVESLIDMPDLPQAERSEVYQVLMKHSGRLNGLVEELLSLARMEARTEQFSWETLAPEAMIREVVTEWQMRAGGNAVETHVEVASELPEVRVDRVRIEQVLHNLLENALKHVPAKGGRIVIRAVYETGEGVRVVVEDNGSGIAHKDLPHIFERFYRADKSRGAAGMRGMGRSTGLGLSIVKHIIAAHGGEVGAESPHGSGARVWFRLPVAPGEQ